jgi:gliding motility-associated-like protein
MKPISTKALWKVNFLLASILTIITGAAFSQPIAKFSSDVVSGCTPVLVNFADQSTGNPSQWKWDLGNGTISNLQNPSVTYFQPGQYTVKLIIKSGDDQDSVVKTSYITVFQAPVVNFDADVTSGCNPILVNFSDNTNPGSTGINSWQWDFGDGVLANQQHPSHTYTQAGNYSVTLKVINSDGCMSNIRKTELIKNSGVVAGFTSKEVSTCMSDKINFQNTSTGSSTLTYYWNFGDGNTSTELSPAYTYATGGDYTAKLVVKNQEGCTDSLIKKIQVLSPVSAIFTADKLLSCTAPQTIKFTNQTKTGNAYFWTFDDSTTSTASNPAHIFADTGIYTIKLVVKNSNGCADSLKITDYIKIQKPFIRFDNLPDSGCQAVTKTLEASIVSSEPITDYLWNFGDGTTSSEVKPAHTFSNIGYYNVSLAVTGANGCADTATMPKAIRVTQRPVAAFSANLFDVCAFSSVNFTNLSTGDVNSFVWDFGDKSNSTDRNPIHQYKDTGWKTISLIALSGGCADTAVIKNFIHLKPSVARFDFITNCANPYQIALKNTSLGADRWLWNFGDGSTSTELQPSHTYASQGVYTITLETWNNETGCYYLKSKQVNILDITPTFFAADSVVCKRDTVRFSSALTNTVVSRFFWDFGDGSSANSASNKITHVYTKAGTYSVRLITVNVANCRDTLLKAMYIKVNGPTAKFGAPAISCAGTPVVFSDSSSADVSNPIIKWVWNYGDGKIDTLTAGSFQHAYLNRGTYNVLLKLTDSKGCTDSFQLNPAIKINKVSAAFTISDSVTCPNTLLKYTCPYFTTGIVYRWDFGDGSTSNLQLPTHKYANEGLYTVKLYARDISGCEDSVAVINAVRISQTIASFEMSDSFRTCPPLLINFTSHSVNGVSETWNFGDSSSSNTINPSHFYSYPGIYTATLTVKGRGGCVKTAQRNIEVKGPKGVITYSPLKLCRPYQVNFNVKSTDAISYIWDFTDGNTAINNDTVVTHLYQDSGKFVPKIILIDDLGCRVPVSGKDTLTNLFVAPAFNFKDSLVCDKATISFANNTLSNDPVSIYRWNFGDGSLSNQRTTSHEYVVPGIYYPTLSVTTKFGCFGEYKSLTPVKVFVSPKVNISSTANGCVPLKVIFNGVPASTDSAGLKWAWDLGNGATSTLQQPAQQVYDAAGPHNISLTATSISGCTKTVTHTVNAYPLPVLSTTADTVICKGQQITLRASGATRYSWLPSSGLNCDTCATPAVSPLSSIQYTVTGESIYGCRSAQPIAINVKQPFKITYSTADKLCAGQTKKLQASGANSYQWSPAKGLSSASISEPTAQPDTTTNYRVIGTDDHKCFNDTGYVKLTVYPMPTVNAGADKTINVGRPVDLKADISGDVVEVKWSPTGDIFRNGNDAITVKPIQNTEYTVDVKNIGGCAARDKVTVFVICNGTNVFVPNLFSPNGDGVNDVFYPRGNGVFKIKGMRIFNRWGEAVYEKKSFNANDPAAGWDGVFRGSKLNSDVFVYTLELICDNESVLTLNGNIALVR